MPITVEVVLTQDDRSLGKRGDIVKVSPGYASNFLIPNQKALLATPAAVKSFQMEKAKHVKQQADSLARARETAAKIEKTFVRIEVLAGEEDKLYGAVTAQDIHEALKHQGISIDRKDLHLDEPIRKLGGHEAAVKLHPEVTAQLRIQVAKKKV